MWIFLLAAAAAAVFWACCILRERRCGVGTKAGAEAPAESGASIRERLEASRTAEVLGEVIDELRMVMGHPQLGGPGYLTVQFPQRRLDGACPTVSCQYPNINEALYRRIVRRELEPGELMEAGVPGRLFSRQVTFATESGGVVVVTAQVRGVEPDIEELMTGRTRGEALYALAGELGRRYPGCTAQALAGEILLTPGLPDRLAAGEEAEQ